MLSIFSKLLGKKPGPDELSEKDEVAAFMADVQKNTWTRPEPITDDDLDRIKAVYRQWFENNPHTPGEIPKCTCDTCDDNRTCTLAYDTYNTNDECLWEK